MSATIISPSEKEKLFTQVLHLLGMPVRGVELTEEQMNSFLEMAISEYEQYVSDWLIESQWSSLANLDVDTNSLTRAFTNRSLDYETQYTYAYSKIVGLQTLTDSIVDPFLGGFGGLGGVAFGGVGGFAQVGAAGSYFLLPAFDLLLRMGDRNIKNRLIGGDLTYRITAGPNGTKIVHLLNVPGGKFDFGSIQNNRQRVWYWYYDAGDNRDECLEKNKDIIRLPSDVMTEPLVWEDLNKPSQNWVRKYFIGYCKEGLARIWGKFSGDLKVPDSEVKLDYSSLLTEGKDERLKLVEELMARLERMRPDKLLERKKNEAEFLNGSLKYRPIQSLINVI